MGSRGRAGGTAHAWTRPAEVRAWLDKKWRSGALLTAFAEGRGWEPLGVPLRGPAAGDIADRLAEVQEWVAEWARAESQGVKGSGLRVEYKKVGGRQVGANMIPCRAWIDSYDHAWGLLGVRAEVRSFGSLVHATAESCPRLVPWVARRPMQLLQLADRWDKLMATVVWIDERQSPGMYLRLVDVPGVDTKFIEGHKGVLAELLDLQLSPSRIDADAADFAERYRFRRKPGYVRFRSGGASSRADAAFSELSVRVDEFAEPPPVLKRVYVLENEITYLAFPLPPQAIVIFGGGYAVDVLEPLGWLAELDLVYWGDIDTHGFAILNRLRHRFGHARSMLMDRATLLAHRSQWVTEPRPTAVTLDMLSVEEAELYRDLVDGTLGASVRLEQERVGFAAIERALARIKPLQPTASSAYGRTALFSYPLPCGFF
jgi:hypothetical protein